MVRTILVHRTSKDGLSTGFQDRINANIRSIEKNNCEVKDIMQLGDGVLILYSTIDSKVQSKFRRLRITTYKMSGKLAYCHTVDVPDEISYYNNSIDKFVMNNLPQIGEPPYIIVQEDESGKPEFYDRHYTWDSLKAMANGSFHGLN